MSSKPTLEKIVYDEADTAREQQVKQRITMLGDKFLFANTQIVPTMINNEWRNMTHVWIFFKQ